MIRLDSIPLGSQPQQADAPPSRDPPQACCLWLGSELAWAGPCSSVCLQTAWVMVLGKYLTNEQTKLRNTQVSVPSTALGLCKSIKPFSL